jgi:hypothetical protein
MNARQRPEVALSSRPVIRGSAFAALIAAVSAWADSLQTPAFVASGANECSAVTCSTAYPHPVAGGNMLVAAIYAAGSTVDGVTDTLGNPWTLAVRQTRSTMTSSTELWFVDGGSAAGANTVTAHIPLDPSPGFLEVHVYEYSGLAPRGPDCTASQDATVSVADSTPCQTHVATELLFGMANPHTPVVSAGPGFTLRETTNCDWDEDRVVTATGSYDAVFQLNGSGDVATVLGAFEAASTSGDQPLKGWPFGCSAGAAGPTAWLGLLLLLAASGCRAARAGGRSGCDPLPQRARRPRRFPRRGRGPL